MRECLDSILAQTYENIEICFSDNASIDESWEIALEYQKRYPDVFFVARNRRNFGVDANFANGWINARGKYFVEVCSDDALLPDFTERCVKALQENVSAGFVMVHRTILDEQGNHVLEAPFYNQTCKIPGAAQAAVYMIAAVNPSVTQIMYRKLFTTGKTVVGGLAGRWYGTRIMDFNMCCDYPMIYIKDPLMLHRLHFHNDSFKAAGNMMESSAPTFSITSSPKLPPITGIKMSLTACRPRSKRSPISPCVTACATSSPRTRATPAATSTSRRLSSRRSGKPRPAP